MLSQVTFANKPSQRESKEKDSRERGKHRSRQEKRSKRRDRRNTDSRSGSPVKHQASPTPAIQPATSVDELHVQQPRGMSAEVPDQMDNLLQDISAVPIQSTEVPKHQKESANAIAPRLEGIPGKSGGLVGDGGSTWRRRMQRRATERATERGEELPKMQSRHGHDTARGKRHWRSAGPEYSDDKANMRRPSQDITSAFGRPQSSDSRTDQRMRSHNRSNAEGAGAAAKDEPRHGGDLLQYGIEGTRQDSAGGHSNAKPSPPAANAGVAVGANMSAAAQLRASLRGEAMPPAAVGKSVMQRQQGHLDSRQPLDKTKRSNQVQRFRDGERQQYFDDDNMHSTAALAKHARLGLDLHDIDEVMARNIVSKRKFRAQELNVDDEYDHDGGLILSERKRSKSETSGSNKERTARPRTDLIESQCRRCFMSPKRNRDLTVSVGMHVYMAMPEQGSLVPGHVMLLPVEHASSFREADDDAYEELKNFQKCLIQMFALEGLSCIFFETALKVKEARTHACIDCVPVDPDAFAAAPMMFRKEISESESEWSQHHSKSIIDTSEKGLRRCVPTKFPYFHVQYGYKRGSLHVIDDEPKWERGFGRSVLVSLTGGKEVEMYRRAQRRNAETERSQKATFAKQWSQFDWTRQLE